MFQQGAQDDVAVAGSARTGCVRRIHQHNRTGPRLPGNFDRFGHAGQRHLHIFVMLPKEIGQVERLAGGTLRVSVDRDKAV